MKLKINLNLIDYLKNIMSRGFPHSVLIVNGKKVVDIPGYRPPEGMLTRMREESCKINF